MTEKYRGAGLREQLLIKEAWDSPLGEKYKSEIQDLLIQKLTPVRRWSLAIVSIFLLGSCVMFGWLALSQTELPSLVRLYFVEGVIFQIVGLVHCVRVLRSGVFHRRRDPIFRSGLMWCFAVVLAVHFLMFIPEVPDVKTGLLFLGVALAAMIGTGLQLLRTCIEQSELNTSELMLKTVLRLKDTSQTT